MNDYKNIKKYAKAQVDYITINENRSSKIYKDYEEALEREFIQVKHLKIILEFLLWGNH
jgi:hypothetical protein